MIPSDCKIILSINRFERKKNINLAINTLACLKKRGLAGLRLVVAGHVLFVIIRWL